MTRINTVDACDLTNEWLIAEVRELPRIVNELRDHPERLVLKDIPKQYTLASGHVKFYRNKLLHLAKACSTCSSASLNLAANLRLDSSNSSADSSSDSSSDAKDLMAFLKGRLT